jgi:osmoprotectant transport system permease protein
MLWAGLLLGGTAPRASDRPIVVGSKNFTESYLLGETFAQLLEDRGYEVERKFGLVGTLIAFEALRTGDLDVYPEYSGTLDQAILKADHRLSYPELQETLKTRFGLRLLEPLGFNSTWAIAVRRAEAERRGLRTIGDLGRWPGLRFGFTSEFIDRHDGWRGLAAAYGLSARPVGMDHGLAYAAIGADELDVTDAYSTDGDIGKFDLVLLEDDKLYFPKYLAVPLVRGNLDERIEAVLNELEGTLTDARMQALNAVVMLEGKSFAEVAARFLSERGLVKGNRRTARDGSWGVLALRTGQHLKLTLLSLLGAIVVAVPLGILVYRFGSLSRPVIYGAGVLQTIPSIALLAFMMPLLGIGEAAAVAALFLYALLPILRNTAMALFSIDPVLKRVSVAMGLTTWQRLRKVELPLTAPTVLAGIKTAAVINVGLATLAAFIGAGGLGEPIVTGLALYDPLLVLEGAIPAAVLAILTELGFDLAEKRMIPRHLLAKPAR